MRVSSWRQRGTLEGTILTNQARRSPSIATIMSPLRMFSLSRGRPPPTQGATLRDDAISFSLSPPSCRNIISSMLARAHPVDA